MTMKKTYTILIWAMIAAATSSCAISKGLNFENKTISTGYTEAREMAIVFQDFRPYVITGKVNPTYCGTIFSANHTGYSIHTQSGHPLWEDFTKSVISSLQQAGIKATEAKISDKITPDSLPVTEIKSDKDRLVMVYFIAWESVMDPQIVTVRYKVNYDFTMSVYDRNGNVMARNHVRDLVNEEHKELAGTVKELQELSDRVFADAMKRLFSSTEIRSALQ